MKNITAIPALSLAAILTLAACAGSPAGQPATTGTSGSSSAPAAGKTPATTASSAPAPPTAASKEPDLGNPESVAAAFIAGAYAWDATKDTTRTDALKRVADLATPKFAQTFVTPQRSSSAAEWMAAAQHQAVSVPAIARIPDARTSVQDTAAPFRILAFRVQWTWEGTDRVRLAGGDELATVTVDKNGSGIWQVTGYSTTVTGQ
ncbi:hypothetical protein [Arthrobacter sp. MMS18-M83]|uniref:hypothetical protein n=1 Tax=Arthrobacter sp. MMS18-M83 TaxID=2996261 RepID=UPI00227B27C3|nr:hypothetical protein [Arthrobacter sp. MMS18-M83]WAH99747.1 hypothetical protein OW521_24100 [Arthrobacter sp. MMS18-M83]